MTKYDLKDMIKGWFIGDFEPSIKKTKEFEVGIKRYKKGDYEHRHYHKLSTEYTVIVSGKVVMNNITYKSDDIIVVKPYEDVDFKALEDTVCVVVKHPSSKGDKYQGVYSD